MPKSVFARFEAEAAADRALAEMAHEIALADSAVLSEGPAAELTLDNLDLAPEERAICLAQLKRGGFLMIAQPASDADREVVLRVLHNAPGERAPLLIAEAAAPRADAMPHAAEPPQPEPEVVAEERIPIVEEELRIGKEEVVRGRARIRSRIVEAPVVEQVELAEERIEVERRPVNRRVDETELASAGLLKERVIEITGMREEAVVTKEAFVREELVVTKHVDTRTERIEEHVRRTVVETEGLEQDSAAGQPRR